MRLKTLEVRIDVLCGGERASELAAAVRKAWDWCLEETADDPADHVTDHRLRALLDDHPERLGVPVDEPSLAGPDLPSLMDRLSPTVTTLAVTERRHDLVMFHACAVADPATGATVVLYGPSGTGKTTMARTLCTDLVYLSDETAGVDATDLRVVPYLKPLSIIASPGDQLKEQVSPGGLGLLRPDDRSYRLTGLVQLDRRPDHAGEAVLEGLATVDALPELVAQTSFTRDMERPLHRLAEVAHRVGGVRRVTYAEAAQLRPLVRSLLDGAA